MLHIVDALLIDPPYNVGSGRKDANSYCDVLTLQNMADAIALCKPVMRLCARLHLSYYELRVVQWYRTLLKARKEKNVDGDVGEIIGRKEGEEREKATFEEEGPIDALHRRSAERLWPAFSIEKLITLAFGKRLCTFGKKATMTGCSFLHNLRRVR